MIQSTSRVLGSFSYDFLLLLFKWWEGYFEAWQEAALPPRQDRALFVFVLCFTVDLFRDADIG